MKLKLIFKSLLCGQHLSSAEVFLYCCYSVAKLHWLFATPWTATHKASLSFTISWSLLRLMSIESVTPSNHLSSVASLLGGSSECIHAGATWDYYVVTADPKVDQWPMRCRNTNVHASVMVISFLQSVSFLGIWPGDVGGVLAARYLKQK